MVIGNQVLFSVLVKGKLWPESIKRCDLTDTSRSLRSGAKLLFTDGDVLLLRKRCRSMVTLQKQISIRGNVVSNAGYKDWVCQLSSETNKPFLTSCPSPPTITGPEE